MSYGQEDALHKHLLEKLLTEAALEVSPPSVAAAALALTGSTSTLLDFAVPRVVWVHQESSALDNTSKQLEALTKGEVTEYFCCTTEVWSKS